MAGPVPAIQKPRNRRIRSLTGRAPVRQMAGTSPAMTSGETGALSVYRFICPARYFRIPGP